MTRRPDLRRPPQLRGLDFTSEEIDGARDGHRLLMISVFVTGLCDLNCVYCYASSGQALPGELTTDEYREIIRQGRDLGARTVWIPGAGEPLLQREFPDIVEYTSSLGMTLVMFTNSTHMTREMATFLYERDVSVITKCNGLQAATQDSLAGSRGAFARIQRGLRNLLEAGYNKDNPTRLGIESVICRQNYGEIPHVFAWARRNNAYPYLELMIRSGRAMRSDLDITAEEARQLFHQLLEIDETDFGYTWTPVPPYVATRCDKLLYNLVVDSQGYVRPCCAIPMRLGNIREKTLREILETSDILSKTRNITEYLKGNCGECGVADCLYGCRSQAYLDGDLFGSYSQCWYSRNGEHAYHMDQAFAKY